MSSQFIHCFVSSISLDSQFFVTIIYGLNTPTERKALWKDLGILLRT